MCYSASEPTRRETGICDPITFSGLDLLWFSAPSYHSSSLRRRPKLTSHRTKRRSLQKRVSTTPWPLAFVLVEVFLLLEIRLTIACGTSRVESQWYAVHGAAAKEIGKVGVAQGHGDDRAATQHLEPRGRFTFQ
jgi:hypothetical protein